MCGIFAAVTLDSSFSGNDYHRFRKALAMVNYRGPDATGHVMYQNTVATTHADNFDVYLGHNRLSIIDLSSQGHQPMIMHDVALIFNGEIFNYIELRDELKQLGHVFTTNTDTEVITKSYLQWGEKGFSKFNGMWAFVLYDLKKNKLVVSRDRFSIKPLYCYKQNNRYYFSSELKQLFHLGTAKKLNREKLNTFLQQSLLDHDNDTFYAGIHKIPAKHNFVIDLSSKKITETPYWDYTITNDKINEIDAIDKFHYLFDRSVQLRLRGDVKVGSLLSGGLDSSAITSTAGKYDTTFNSFSAIFDHTRYSEKKHIAAFSEKTAIPNTSFLFPAKDIIAKLDESIYHQEQPFASFSITAQYMLFEKIKQNSDVVCLLCGQGADEILMGYMKYYYFALQHGVKKFHAGSFFGNLFGSLYNGTALRQFSFSNSKRYMPFLRAKKSKYMLEKSALEKIWDSNDLQKRQVLDVDKYSVPILNHHEDRNSMAHSLEVRLPFLDHELVDFCISLPYNLKIRKGWTKYVLRKSINTMPEEISWRKDKQGFVTPEIEWIKHELREDVVHTLKKSRLQEMGIMDAKIVLDEYSKWVNGNRSGITYEEFLRIYITEKWLANLEKNHGIHA